jgi:polyisoprenoid-binding protein YceI
MVLLYFYQSILLILFTATCCFALPWNTPQKLSTENSKLEFEVDSTWHKVHGIVKNISGKVWLTETTDPLSVRANLTLPVNSFDTDNQSRDKKMRSVMNEKEFPYVNFDLTSVEGLCLPETLKVDETCHGFAIGDITINNVTMPIRFPISVTSQHGNYLVNGNATIDWPDFDIKDPSIIIAKVYPRVNINFVINLKPENINEQH